MLSLKFGKLIEGASLALWFEAVARICFERIGVYISELEGSIGVDVGKCVVDDVNFASGDILWVELSAVS